MSDVDADGVGAAVPDHVGETEKSAKVSDGGSHRPEADVGIVLHAGVQNHADLYARKTWSIFFCIFYILKS